jgi:hypothetical protein
MGEMEGIEIGLRVAVDKLARTTRIVRLSLECPPHQRAVGNMARRIESDLPLAGVCKDDRASSPGSVDRVSRLRRRGFLLERITLFWNVVGVIVLAVLAISASSTALAGFGLDSLIEIGASTVVLWELSDTGEQRQRRALQLIGAAFIALAIYLLVQSAVALITQHHPAGSVGGIAWTAFTAVGMFTLAG